jgi:hypothetical protein
VPPLCFVSVVSFLFLYSTEMYFACQLPIKLYSDTWKLFTHMLLLQFPLSSAYYFYYLVRGLYNYQFLPH